jgi:hypothetical protein
MSEIPVHFRPRILLDWIDPTDAKKVHALTSTVNTLIASRKGEPS